MQTSSWHSKEKGRSKQTRRATPTGRDAIAILRERYPEPEFRLGVEQAKVTRAIARLVYEAREKAKLSQAELAAKLGTKQPAISRLEDADYQGGHSLTKLVEVAHALGYRLNIELVRR